MGKNNTSYTVWVGGREFEPGEELPKKASVLAIVTYQDTTQEQREVQRALTPTSSTVYRYRVILTLPIDATGFEVVEQLIEAQDEYRIGTSS